METLKGNDIEIWIHWLAGSIKQPVAVLKQMKYCSKQRRRSGAEREAAFKLKSYERQSLGWSRDKFEFPSGSSNDFVLIDLNRKRSFFVSPRLRSVYRRRLLIMGAYSGDSGALCALRLMRALFAGISRIKASGVRRSTAFEGSQL